MRRLLPVATVALWPLAAAAEDVRVRSGEHPGFSRLVLEFTARPAWSLRTGERRATIVLAPGERSFGLGDVFTRIPRTRIRAVAASAAGLELELGCDCTVTAFEVRDSALAIDVSDRAEMPEEPSNVTPTAASGGAAEASPVVAASPLPIRTPDGAPTPAAASPRPDPPPRPPRMALPAAPEPDSGPAGPGSDGTRGGVLSELTQAIARATTQGNLRLAETPEQAAAAPPEALLADPAAGNLRLRLPGEEAWLPDAPPDGVTCRDGDSFNVASWVPADLDPADAIGGLHADLAPDLDRIDEDRAVALARLYVGLGFGAEARAVIAALAPRHPEAALLEEMARIVDGEPMASGLLVAEADCPGRAQLWAALATGRANRLQDVIVAVGELPVPLRRHLAPRVMSMLRAEGHDAAAEAIRGTVERAAGPHGAAFALASAQMEAQRNPEPDLDAVRDLAAGSAPSADDALAVLLDLARTGGAALDAATLARAETRANDLRGTETARKLEAGLIHAHLRAGDFRRAALWLAKVLAEDGTPQETTTALAREVFATLAARGTEEDLLLLAARFAGGASDIVRSDAAGAALAARLLELGFPDLALLYLPEAPADPGTQKLAAQARILSADPEGALEILADVDPRDAERARLWAEALRALGRTDEAPASTLPNRDNEAPAPEETGAARALVDASEAARQRVDALLSAVPAP